MTTEHTGRRAELCGPSRVLASATSLLVATEVHRCVGGEGTVAGTVLGCCMFLRPG